MVVLSVVFRKVNTKSNRATVNLTTRGVLPSLRKTVNKFNFVGHDIHQHQFQTLTGLHLDSSNND